MKKILFFLLISVSVNAQISTRCKVCPPSLDGVPDGYVLTDSSGYARWQASGGGGGSSWSLTGNAGTNPATDFIGTTDYKDLRLKRNGNTNIEISSDNKGEHVYIMDSLGNKLFESISMNGDFSANLGSDTTYVVADNGGGELDISSSTTVIHHPNGGACKMVTQCDSIFNDSDTLTYLGTETYRYKEVNTYNANVTGSFKYANGTQAAGKVLTSDANGLAYWGSQILTDTATLDFGVITAHDQEILTVTITGVVLSDVVTLGIPQSTMNTEKLSFNAWVSSADTVSIKCYNFDGANIDPASGLFKIKVFK